MSRTISQKLRCKFASADHSCRWEEHLRYRVLGRIARAAVFTPEGMCSSAFGDGESTLLRRERPPRAPVTGQAPRAVPAFPFLRAWITTETYRVCGLCGPHAYVFMESCHFGASGTSMSKVPRVTLRQKYPDLKIFSKWLVTCERVQLLPVSVSAAAGPTGFSCPSELRFFSGTAFVSPCLLHERWGAPLD